MFWMLLVPLQGPDGIILIAPSQVVAVQHAPGIGKCPTAVTTLNGTFYVCEPVETVKKKLESSP